MKYYEKSYSEINKPISKIAMGTARFGSRIPTEKAFAMLDLFEENGGNVLDTARNYDEWAEDGRGKSEQCIGKWMEQKRNRKEMVVCTKGGVKRDTSGNRYFDLSCSNLLEEVKESLYSLRSDYIDIYLLHKDEKSRPVEEIVESMQKVCDVGNIPVIGVANWSYERLKQANDYAKLNGYKEFKIVQTWWALAEYTKEMWNDEHTTHMTQEMYIYMRENHILGMAYTAQCKGFFQKAIKNGLDKVDDFLKKRIVTSRNLEKLNYLADFCRENKVEPTGVVNSYITDNQLHGIALVSCSNIEQLQEILNWSDYVLSLEIIKRIDEI